MSNLEDDKSDHEQLFAARLTPYRSLGRKGFILLMCFVSVTCFISGILFLSIGAWPVFMFFGLDILLVWLAFKLNYHSAKGYEEIAVFRDEVKIRQFAPSGRITTHSFNPFWTKFNVERHEEYGVMKLALSTKESELEIGSFLNAYDKESFARSFGGAFARAKSG